MRDEYSNILRNQKEYLEKNVINKKVDLFKENILKRVGGNPGYLNNDSSGKGKGRGGGSGGARGREHRNRAPQTHGGQGNFGGGNNFQDNNCDESMC